MGNIPRGYVADSFHLTLDGVECGFLRSAAGGSPVGDVVVVTGGPGGFADKQIGAVHYEDIELQTGLSLTNDLYEWINASWQLDHKRKSGAIAAVATTRSIHAVHEFTDALVGEVTIPALDGSSKDQAYLTVKLRPEQVTRGKGGDTLPRRATKQKSFVASNFRVEIDGLDCKMVAKIDSFTVRQTITTGASSGDSDLLEPGALDFPNLSITLAEASAGSWQEWADDFLVKGNNGPAQERSGALTFLAPDLTQLARIELMGLGIVSLRRPARADAAEAVARVVAELYCERMALHVGA